MKPILMAGSALVSLALISYSFAFVLFRKRRKLDRQILLFQTLGLLLDITATILMISGSSKGPFTLHGVLGYSSLTLMILDTAFFWNFRKSQEYPLWMKKYSSLAYFWWILAYLTGTLLVILR